MDLHATLARLTRHPVFTDWREKNKDYFLTHAFVMLDEANKDTWQIGFYHPGEQNMITFVLTGDSVQYTETKEVLKSEGEIKQLRPEEVTLSIEKALEIAQTCMDDNYKGELPIKHFFIIQNTEEHHMFNITYFTRTFTTINIKIDAKDGTIIKHSKQKIAEFG